MGELLSPQELLNRTMTHAGSYVVTWLFFAGISFAIAAAFGPSQALRNREFRILTLGSLAGVFLVQIVSFYPFARYCYPLMWAGLLGVFLIIEFKNRALACALFALQMCQAVPLFTHSTGRFTLWPQLVTGELIDSGGTVFSGLPIYGMTAWQLVRDQRPCVWVNSENGEKNELVQRLAASVFPDSPIITSPFFQSSGSSACSPSNTVRLWREHVENANAGCVTGCRRCEFQKVGYYSVTPGWIRNQICWPRR